VRVPAGRHLVEYAYRPRPLAFGLAVSAISLLVAAALLRKLPERRDSLSTLSPPAR
jgi:hypothetical protein